MLPILLLVSVDTHKLIGETFDRFDDGIEERPAVCVEHFAKVNAERFCNRQEGDDEEHKLNPA